MKEVQGPDNYLVLAGPVGVAVPGTELPTTIDLVYFFQAETLIREQQRRGVKVGVASSVRKQQWNEAEIYPVSNSQFPLTGEQRALLRFFANIGQG